MSAVARLWAGVAALIGLALVIQVAELAPLLRYSRPAIAAGEVWRLLTGHLVHLGAAHLALNAAGTVLIAALVGHHLGLRAWAATTIVCALAVAAGLWWLAPQIDWYVGLSGVLHGLLVAGAIAALASRRERVFALIVLAVIATKLAWEQALGPTPGTAALSGGPVVTEAHLFGALGGLLAGASALFAGWRQHRPPYTD